MSTEQSQDPVVSDQVWVWPQISSNAVNQKWAGFLCVPICITQLVRKSLLMKSFTIDFLWQYHTTGNLLKDSISIPLGCTWEDLSMNTVVAVIQISYPKCPLAAWNLNSTLWHNRSRQADLYNEGLLPLKSAQNSPLVQALGTHYIWSFLFSFMAVTTAFHHRFLETSVPCNLL